MSTTPVRCSHFTLGNPKKSFSTVLFIHTSDYLGYFRRKQTNPLAHTIWKCHHTNLWNAKLFRQTGGLLRSFKCLESLKRASCGLFSVALKRTSCDVWQLECQASSVTASVQSDHMLPVIFDQSHSTPRCAEIQPMSLESATASRNMSISVHVLLLKHAPDAVLGLCK